MKTELRMLAVALIAGGTMFAQTRFSIGIGVGGYGPGYYPPPNYEEYVAPCPGPDYSWVDGYWEPQGGRNVWFDGYWRRPYVSGYRVAPRYVQPRYYNSYRGYDRDWGDNRYQNRGNQRFENRGNQRFDNRGGERYDNRGNQRYDNRGNQRYDNRGKGYSNGFRR